MSDEPKILRFPNQDVGRTAINLVELMESQGLKDGIMIALDSENALAIAFMGKMTPERILWILEHAKIVILESYP